MKERLLTSLRCSESEMYRLSVNAGVLGMALNLLGWATLQNHSIPRAVKQLRLLCLSFLRRKVGLTQMTFPPALLVPDSASSALPEALGWDSLGAGVSFDAARFPRHLPEAYCLCRGCLTGPAGTEDTRFRSAPVYAPAVVLRRTAACAGGRAVYREHYIALPVGCTCVPAPAEVAASPDASSDEPSDQPGP
ncbi:interleukin-17D isoform X4 [Sorex araneus]|uniref:interleukin-17D isoform X4 n=1 Tax=Sorex araneus TaxID=42254 RepID=UPI002433A630|nr:interleukin-17D isoform X4 [Sorex araneus]